MVGKAIYSLLSGDGTVTGLVGTKIYPAQLPDDKSHPSIVYRIDNVDPVHTKDGTVKLDIVRSSLDIYSSTYDEANQIADAARDAMNDQNGTIGGLTISDITIESAGDANWDIELQVFHLVQTYNIWHINP